MKSLPFHIPEAWKRYLFRAEPLRIGHHREYPPGPCKGLRMDSKVCSFSVLVKKTDCVSVERELEIDFTPNKIKTTNLMKTLYFFLHSVRSCFSSSATATLFQLVCLVKLSWFWWYACIIEQEKISRTRHLHFPWSLRLHIFFDRKQC